MRLLVVEQHMADELNNPTGIGTMQTNDPRPAVSRLAHRDQPMLPVKDEDAAKINAIEATSNEIHHIRH